MIRNNRTKDPTKYAMSAQGGLIICGGHKGDSGSYKVEIYKMLGELRENRTIHLRIEGM